MPTEENVRLFLKPEATNITEDKEDGIFENLE